ncbi:MAG: hypothetical protein J5755_05690, partial [Clostridia bacterium]|nr:hypothetical protein [Clostridia bacterium]
MTNQEPTKNLNAMKELDDKMFRGLVADLKEARKRAESLYGAIKDKKDALIAERVAREQEEAARLAKEAEEAARREAALRAPEPEEEEPQEEPEVKEEEA